MAENDEEMYVAELKKTLKKYGMNTDIRKEILYDGCIPEKGLYVDVPEDWSREKEDNIFEKVCKHMSNYARENGKGLWAYHLDSYILFNSPSRSTTNTETEPEEEFMKDYKLTYIIEMKAQNLWDACKKGDEILEKINKDINKDMELIGVQQKIYEDYHGDGQYD